MQTHLPSRPKRPNLSFETPHSRWLALTSRDPASHSSFLYGVKSTKIYCRPTCPARLARRANVVFYDTEEQARRDGFRPCKRCRPDNAGYAGVGEEIVSRVIALMRVKRASQSHHHHHHHHHSINDDRDDSELAIMKRSVKDLAHEVGVSPSYLCRVFKKRMGVTIGTYMIGFEREGTEADENEKMGGLVRSSSDVPGSGLPADTVWSSPTAPQGLGKDLVGLIGLEESEDALDLNFDFEEWFWSEDFVHDRSVEYNV